MLLDYRYLLKILPHRYPFLLIDNVDYQNTDTVSAIGIKNVTFNEPFFMGHFPDDPVMPGVLLIEAAAQTALVFKIYDSLIKIHSDTEILKQNININVRFASINKVKFRQEVRPGTILHFYIKQVKDRPNFASFEAKIFNTFNNINNNQDTDSNTMQNLVAELDFSAWLL